MKHFLSLFLMLHLLGADAQTLLKIDNSGLTLDGYFYAASTNKAPAIVALHGCGGMLNPQGKPNLRTNAYANLLNEQGWHVLFLDSFAGRGVKSVCGGADANNVTPAARVPDVQAAIKLLAGRVDVDADRLGILGWSHGGSVTLLSNAKGVDYAGRVRAAVAFYPGCGTSHAQRTWLPAHPILMQLGAADDWTNPVPCQSLAARWQPLVQQDTYANAAHGFDSDAPVRAIALRTPQGNKTVHAGGEPAGKAASQAKLIGFFKAQFQ